MSTPPSAATQFDLRDFASKGLAPGSVALVQGARGSGKTTLVWGLARSATPTDNEILYLDGDWGRTASALARVPPQINVLVFDNYDGSAEAQDALRSVVARTGPQLYTILVATQYALDVPLFFRNKLDYVFVFPDTNRSAVRAAVPFVDEALVAGALHALKPWEAFVVALSLPARAYYYYSAQPRGSTASRPGSEADEPQQPTATTAASWWDALKAYVCFW